MKLSVNLEYVDAPRNDGLTANDLGNSIHFVGFLVYMINRCIFVHKLWIRLYILEAEVEVYQRKNYICDDFLSAGLFSTGFSIEDCGILLVLLICFLFLNMT
jgi:hypothetical protein